MIIKACLKTMLIILLAISIFSCGELEYLFEDIRQHNAESSNSHKNSNDNTLIPPYAFANNSLTSINLPAEITLIDKGAFSDNHLASIRIPESVQNIREGAFVGNPLERVILSKDLYEKLSNPIISTSISIERRRQHLAKIFGSQVKEYLFFKTANEKLLIIPEGTVHVEFREYAHKQFTKVIMPNSLDTIGKEAFAVNRIHNVHFGNSVTEIDSSAFSFNQLRNVTLPNSLKYIQSGAFYKNKLTSVTIPKSVVSIEESAFTGNPLTDVILSKELYKRISKIRVLHFNTGNSPDILIDTRRYIDVEYYNQYYDKNSIKERTFSTTENHKEKLIADISGLENIFGDNVRYWNIDNPSEELNETTIDHSPLDLAQEKTLAKAERQAKAEAEPQAKAEAERRAKAEAERKAKAEAERRAKAEAERKAKAEAERRAKAETERKAKAETERKTDAERVAEYNAKAKAKYNQASKDIENSIGIIQAAYNEVYDMENLIRITQLGYNELYNYKELYNYQSNKNISQMRLEQIAQEVTIALKKLENAATILGIRTYDHRVLDKIASAEMIIEENQRRKAEAERQAKAEAERQAKAEAERQAKAEAERQAKAEAERQAKAEAERQAKAEAERQAKAEAERQAKAEAERQAKAEAERQAKAEADLKDAKRLVLDAHYKASSAKDEALSGKEGTEARVKQAAQEAREALHKAENAAQVLGFSNDDSRLVYIRKYVARTKKRVRQEEANRLKRIEREKQWAIELAERVTKLSKYPRVLAGIEEIIALYSVSATKKSEMTQTLKEALVKNIHPETYRKFHHRGISITREDVYLDALKDIKAKLPSVFEFDEKVDWEARMAYTNATLN